MLWTCWKVKLILDWYTFLLLTTVLCRLAIDWTFDLYLVFLVCRKVPSKPFRIASLIPSALSQLIKRLFQALLFRKKLTLIYHHLHQKVNVWITSHTLQFQIIGVRGRGPADNLNIISINGGTNKRVGGGVWKLFSVRSGNPLSLIMGIITLAKSQSARRASQQPVFMGECLTISHTCLPSYVFASFAFLMFSVFTFQEKWKRLHSRLRQD